MFSRMLRFVDCLKRASVRCCLLFLPAFLLFSAAAFSATPAGTVISNQASALYRDDSGQWQRVTSNLVQTTVQQVAALTLDNDQTSRAVSAGTARFVHRVTNTGNGDDRFTLAVLNNSGDDFDLSALSIYADSDENGLPDSDSVITISNWLAPDESFSFVIEGLLPSSLTSADSASLQVRASSEFDTSLQVLNTDTIDVGEGAVLQVTKQFSQSSGVTSSQSFDTVITVENTGNDTATDIVLLDALPQGMDYITNSASLNASASVLSDADASDVQTSGTLSARFCAYHSSCTALPESGFDADASSINQITLLLDSLAVGETASLRFSVKVETDIGEDVLINQAELEYQGAGGGTTENLLSNRATYRVLPTAGVVANGSTLVSLNGTAEPVIVNAASQAGRVYFSNRIWNTGTRVDTFNMLVEDITSTLPAGSAYQLLQADAQTPLLDSSGDGIADTGPVQPGNFVTIVLAVQLPPDAIGNNAGMGFSINKSAQSINDSRVADSVTDTLNQIDASAVDLTNDAPAGDALATGQGAGPELNPVTSLQLNNGTAVFDLFVRHVGEVPDQYLLSAASSASGAPLPAGVKVRFVNPSSGLTLLSTGPLGDGDSVHVQAIVQVDAAVSGNVLSLYFKAESPTTGVVDIKHDAIQNLDTEELSLSPNLSAYVSAGESVVYKHRLANIGNVPINDIDIEVVHDLPGWQIAVFSDTDGNGMLSALDAPLVATMSLMPAESSTFFVKVFAPANAALNQRAISQINASWSAGSRMVTVHDISTVSAATVMILKEQAVDVGCDGAPDNVNGFVTEPLAVEPGNTCVVYRLTATNQGSVTSYSVAIHDATPPYTRYSPAAICSHPSCVLTEPVGDSQGKVKAVVSSLQPGEAFQLQFSVRVE